MQEEDVLAADVMADLAGRLQERLRLDIAYGAADFGDDDIWCFAVAGLIGGMLPADPDLATRLNLEELPAVTGVDLWASIPAEAGCLGAEEFAQMARTLDIPAPPRW